MGALRTFLAATAWTVVASIEERLRPARKLLNNVIACQDRVAELKRELARLGDRDSIAARRDQTEAAFTTFKYSAMGQLAGCADMECFECEKECQTFLDRQQARLVLESFVQIEGELNFARIDLRNALEALHVNKPDGRGRVMISCAGKGK
jgi:hypothetical protein